MLLLISISFADSLTLSPVIGVVTPATLKPGLRAGWEPDPRLAIEAVGHWESPAEQLDLGLSLAGRTWFAGQPGEGLYLHGRLVVGMSVESELTSPWGALQGGFGARPRPWLGIEAALGPEYGTGLPIWRSELSLTFVFGSPADKRPGTGTTRHRPRSLP